MPEVAAKAMGKAREAEAKTPRLVEGGARDAEVKILRVAKGEARDARAKSLLVARDVEVVLIMIPITVRAKVAKEKAKDVEAAVLQRAGKIPITARAKLAQVKAVDVGARVQVKWGTRIIVPAKVAQEMVVEVEVKIPTTAQVMVAKEKARGVAARHPMTERTRILGQAAKAVKAKDAQANRPMEEKIPIVRAKAAKEKDVAVNRLTIERILVTVRAKEAKGAKAMDEVAATTVRTLTLAKVKAAEEKGKDVSWCRNLEFSLLLHFS